MLLTKSTSKKLSGALLAAMMMAAGHAAHAASISLIPSETTLGLNDTLSVDVVVSGLTASETIGAFDFTFDFNADVTEFSAYSFGNDLGTLGDYFDSSNTESSDDGSISLTQTSFLSVADLQTNQPDSFTLATLDFLMVGLGISELSSSYQLLSDEYGLNEIAAPAIANVEVSAVPVPAAAWLFGSALMGLMGLSRRRNKK